MQNHSADLIEQAESGLFEHILHLSSHEKQVVVRALNVAKEAHKTQLRQDGSPYITHPIQVAIIIAKLKLDYQMIAAAIMHDVIEDTDITYQYLVDEFGIQIANIINGLSKIQNIHITNKEKLKAENYQKMMLAISQDIRVIIIKLADRLHNIITLGIMRSDKKKRIARETLDIYVSMASHLGIRFFVDELEDLCFQNIYPLRYQRLQSAINKTWGAREKILTSIQNDITDSLNKSTVKYTIKQHKKNTYSVYKKMLARRKSFVEIMDVFALAITVKNTDECYKVLGVVHSCFKPVFGRFKDYIAIPKENGYQALHTTLFGIKGIPVEIYIRTESMESDAFFGIVNLLRNKNTLHNQFFIEKYKWFTRVFEIQHQSNNYQEFLENMKTSLSATDILVFTPKGEIIALPRYATAVDFAYAIHTELGNHCVACIVNKKLADLSQQLHSGYLVEIITDDNAYPQEKWLDFVVTSKARLGIKQTLRERHRNKYINIGKTRLNDALKVLNMQLDDISEEVMQTILNRYNVISVSDLLEIVGLKEDNTHNIINLIRNQPLNNEITQEVVNYLFVRTACCKPLPGDNVVGLQCKHNIEVHLADCSNVNNNSDRIIPFIDWQTDNSEFFNVEIQITANKSNNVLLDIILCINNMQAHLESINKQYNNNKLLINLEFSVRNRDHFRTIIKKIKNLKDIKFIKFIT